MRPGRRRSVRSSRERGAPSSRAAGVAGVALCALLLGPGAAHAQQGDPAGEAPPPPLSPATSPAPLPPEVPLESLTPEQRLTRGANLFEYGDCAGAIQVLEPLASPGKLKDEREQVEVHRMLGVCYYQLGRIADASRELNSLLYIDPDYTLDPFLTPPPVVELFQAQKQGIQQKLEEIRRARERNGEEKPTAGILVERTTVVREAPFATVFLPFGLSQVANGDLVKGIVLGAVQGGLLLTNVSAYWATFLLTRPGVDGSRVVAPDRPGDAAAYTALQYVHVGALMALVGAYVYGIGDAWWFREDRKIVEKKEARRELSPEEMRPLRMIDGDAE